VSEMDPREAEMDSLLRRSLSTPVPGLSAGFDERLSREMRRRSQPLNPNGRRLLGCYALLSAAVCVVVMHGQGLGWEAVTLMTLGPLALVAAGRSLGRTKLGHSVR
jgi:peptidoglycan/LPS O-acetylase OafA/YrhL